MAVVIGYGPGPLVTPLADAIRQAVSRNRPASCAMCCAWTRAATGPICAASRPAAHPKGCPLTPPHIQPRAAMAASGQQVLASRDALAATIAPVTGSAAEAMKRETRRAERIAATPHRQHDRH